LQENVAQGLRYRVAKKNRPAPRDHLEILRGKGVVYGKNKISHNQRWVTLHLLFRELIFYGRLLFSFTSILKLYLP